MLKKKKNCTVCQAITDNPKIAEDIYSTNRFTKSSKRTLRQLSEDYSDKFIYTALLNHVKKHQYLSEEDFAARNLRDIAKSAERKILLKKMESVDVWDEVIGEGMDKLKKGEMKLSAQDLLRAAKDKSDFQFKKADSELKLAEMVFFFASGENKQELSRPYDRRIIEGEESTDFDPTKRAPGNTGEIEDRPSGVHYPPSWDAST